MPKPNLSNFDRFCRVADIEAKLLNPCQAPLGVRWGFDEMAPSFAAGPKV